MTTFGQLPNRVSGQPSTKMFGCIVLLLHAAVGDGTEAAAAGRPVGGLRLDTAVVTRVANGRVPEAQRALVAFESVSSNFERRAQYRAIQDTDD